MAMIDYGAVVKKNGKIISDPHEMFQNFTNLKYETEEVTYTDESGDEHWDIKTVIDETVIESINYGTDKIEKHSMAGNYFALIGDAEMMIGFYKTWFKIAVDKKEVDMGEYFCHWQSDLKRDFVYEYPKLGRLTIKRIDKRARYCNVYIASFSYKGDKYDVMFGYGVDPSIDYTFGPRNYYAPSKPDKKALKHTHWPWVGYTEWNRSKSKNHADRRILRRMRAWYREGLEK